MIKSIFIKYISAFLVIITVSFVILASIISAYIIKYSNETKQHTMANAAAAAAQYIRDTSGFETAIYQYNALISFAELAEHSFIFITDPEGKIVYSTVEMSYYKKDSVSNNLMQEILSLQKTDKFQSLDGLFNTGHLIFTQVFHDNNNQDLNNISGVLFYCSPSASGGGFTQKVINTIVVSCLWILVATMVIIYFMTEKVISPVRAMSRAAKSFAKGKFDVRVPVRGGDEIAELADAFNKMAADLATNEESKRTFLANVSHDLRTPMTTIGGFIGGILDGTIESDKHEYYLNIIASEIQRLSRLVTTMLDVTRMQAGERKFNKINFDICELARLVLISLEHKINAKFLEVEFDCTEDKMQVCADSDAVHQILYNLCENAIKFTPEKGIMKINIYEKSEEKEKKIYISVYNSGEGITPEDLPFVFDRFYKSDRSRGLDKTGVGLGLFIVKTIIDAHEESINVTSVYGEYCEFVFSLKKVVEKR